MNLAGMSSNATFAARSFPQTIEAEFCSCDCDYVEYAFHDASTDAWKNDKASFLMRKIASTETWAVKILKNGQVEDTISDSTYGEYYDFGDLLYADLKGVVVYWKNVFDAFGNGDYQIRIEKTFAGNTIIKDSHYYRVRPYSFEQAKGTVKLETFQNGTFVGTGVTFRGLDWYQSMRVQGRFWNKQPKIETTEYISSNRQRTQTYDTIVNSYSMEVRNIPSFISNGIIYDQLLANEIYITDYNINNEVYRYVPVRIQAINNAEYYRININGNFEMTFTDKSEGTIKSY
jgi:hypothetical protein